MKFGLNEKTIGNINAVFKKHSQVERAILYGSRAKGTYKNGSDIDLAIDGYNLDLHIISTIMNDLDNLAIPYKFDISVLKEIENPDLIDHIKRIGKVFYKPEGNK